MDDLRTKLRNASDSFGEPGYTLDHLEGMKTRRERRGRVAVIAVVLVIVSLSGSLLWAAFVDAAPDTQTAGESLGVENGRISFIVGEFGGSMEGIQLASAEPDGSNPRTLIDGVPENLTGGLSPDGSTIVFSRDLQDTPEGDASIWMMGADGSDLRQLTDGYVDHDAQWSPDGTRILFLRSSPDGERRCDGHICRDAAPAIFVMNADGSGLRHLGEPSLVVLGARWSPEGERIVYTADTWADDGREGLGIYVMRSDGTGIRRIVPRLNGTPQWSPNGQRILFQFGSRLVTVDSAGSNLTPLVEGFHRDVHFRWSPNGARLLYVRPVDPDRRDELWVAAADGSEERLVAEDLQWPDATATWSPDGRLIAFTRDGDIWTVNVESGAEQQVTDTPTYESLPAWGAR